MLAPWIDWSWALLFGLAVLALGLDARNLPSEAFWEDRAWLRVVYGVALTLGPLKSAVDAWRLNRKSADCREALQGLHNELVDDLGHQYRDRIVVSAFLVRRPRLWRRELYREDRVGGHNRQPSGIRWPKKRGLIGVCWKRNFPVLVDFNDFWGRQQPHDIRHCDDRTWRSVPRHVRFRLSHRDRDWTLANTPAIAAVPIQSRRFGLFIGCVSVDCPSELLGRVWDRRDLIQGAAKAIGFQSYR